MKRERAKKIRRVIAGILTACLVAALALMPMLAARQETAGEQAAVRSAQPEYRDIDTRLVGGGQLAGQAAVAVELPAEVKLTGYLVENGDTVRAGDAIAAVERVSVMTAIAAVQQTLDDLTEQIADAASSASSQNITAVSGGVVKTLYAQVGDNVQDVMLEHGALAVLSLDGYMAVQLSASAQPGQTVTVTLPGGAQVPGTVYSSVNGTLTVTVEDDGYPVGASVAVTDAEGKSLGSGALYILSPWNVTAYAGTVSQVYAAEGASVYAGQTLLRLEDLGTSGEYQQLLDQRHEYETLMQELFGLYETQRLTAPCDGVVTGIDRDSDLLLEETDSQRLSADGLADAALVPMSDTEYLDENQDADPPQPDDGGAPEEPTCTGAADCPAKTHDPGCLSQQQPASHTYQGYAAQIITLSGSSAYVRRSAVPVAVEDLDDLPAVSADLSAMTLEQSCERAYFSGMSAGDVVLLVFDETGALVKVGWISSDPTQPTQPTDPVPTEPDAPTEPTQPDAPEDPTQPGGSDAGDTLPGGGISGGFSGGFSGGGTQQEESAALYSLERVTAASVTAQERMTLEITVDELDITRVRVGQSAAVTLDALPGERFEATVSQVAASGTNEGGSSKFTVELTLPRSGDMLSGMRACAFLTLDTTEHTLTVPAAALDEADGQTVLYTALDPDTGAPAAPLPVETGLADADYVQLLTPLPEETTVYYLYYE